jgi:rhodanese-related sulfurtransferase
MAIKGFKDYMAEANAVIATCDIRDALKAYESGDAVFVDVRESQEFAHGHIPGAIHVPRGFLEFIVDPAGPMHNPALDTTKRVLVYCATGGRSTLAAKTLGEMGVGRVANVVGGFQAWTAAGGETER